MNTTSITFKVEKIGTTANDKLFARIASDAPVTTIGILKVKGKATVYMMELDELPEGIELTEARDDGKLYTNSLGEVPTIDLQHVRLDVNRPWMPVDFTIQERMYIGNDGVERTGKWLVAKRK